MEDFEIQGRRLTMPVEVRDASSWAAQYLVDADAAQRMVAATGLEVAEPLPGRAIVSILFVQYRDSDLGVYNEVGVAVAVRRHDAPPAGALGKAMEVARSRIGAYIHHLPVNQTFTLEAGRAVWGYPKFLSHIHVERSGDRARCTLESDGEHILTLAVHDGGPVPMPAPSAPTYTLMDGVLRYTPWTVNGRASARLGGASLVLGDHSIAKELRDLGLPKRPLMSVSVPRLRARFGASQIVG